MHIISGTLKNREILFYKKGKVRPTPSVIRKTIFNWLMYKIQDSCCLDLFAGTGSLGFEALSRGAKKVIFIDKLYKCCSYINKNVKNFTIHEKCTVLHKNLFYVKNKLKEYSFDIIFCDPPFYLSLIKKSLNFIKLLKKKKDIYIYIEMEKNSREKYFLEKNFIILKKKSLGNSEYYLIKY